MCVITTLVHYASGLLLFIVPLLLSKRKWYYGVVHRVNQKQKKIVLLRFLAYGITIFLSILTTVTLLYVALGYRFDGSGHVVQNGLLLVDNRPEAARILIDGEEKDAATPGRFVLPEGEYDLQLLRENYRSWQKTIAVSAGNVRQTQYPLLIPTELTATNVSDLGTPYLMSQSLNKERLLLHSDGASSFALIALGGDEANYPKTSVEFSAAMPQEGGNYGTFKVIEWALNNRQLLLEQTLPSGAKNLLSFDVTQPSSFVNITQLYGSNAPHTLHYVGGDTTAVYGIHENILRRYELAENRTTTLLSDVRSYRTYDDDTVAYEQVKATGSVVGVWRDGVATAIHGPIAGATVASLQYFKYDDHDYLAFSTDVGAELFVYRDPIKKPILDSQLPFVKLNFAAGARLAVSPSSQFLLAQHGNNVVVYDFEDKALYTFTPESLSGDVRLRWVTGGHLLFQATDSTNYLLEYDGNNQQVLQKSVANYPAFFSADIEKMYELAAADGVNHLRMTSLVAQ